MLMPLLRTTVLGLSALGLASCSHRAEPSATSHPSASPASHTGDKHAAVAPASAQPSSRPSTPADSHAAGAASSGLTVGVNITNPYKGSVAEQDEILAQLAAAGVKTIRVGIGHEGTVGFVERAYRLGIESVVIVSIPSKDGAHVRPADAAYNLTWSSAGLSELDTEKLKTSFGEELKTLEDAGVHLRAIELGNEINWTPFNGDFPVPAPGRILAIADLRGEADAETKVITAGFTAYVRALAVVKELRDHARLNQRTPVLAAGLADCGLPGQHPGAHRDCVSVPATMEYLQEKGADKYVDGYGVHIYPGEGKRSSEELASAFEKDALERCTAARPCWVTEWGLNNKPKTCPLDDDARAGVAETVRHAFQTFVDKGRLAGLLYFSWSGEPHDDENQGALFRCHAVTKTGKIARAP